MNFSFLSFFLFLLISSLFPSVVSGKELLFLDGNKFELTITAYNYLAILFSDKSLNLQRRQIDDVTDLGLAHGEEEEEKETGSLERFWQEAASLLSDETFPENSEIAVVRKYPNPLPHPSLIARKPRSFFRSMAMILNYVKSLMLMAFLFLLLRFFDMVLFVIIMDLWKIQKRLLIISFMMPW